MNKNDILSHVGAEDWEMVKLTWQGKNLEEILSDLNYMFPYDDNSQLVEDIFAELNNEN